MTLFQRLFQFFSPSSPVDEEVTDPVAIDLRDPLVDPQRGDVFAGIYGGIRKFIGYDPEHDEAMFTRSNSPKRYRESRAKWNAFLQTATIVRKHEVL